MKKLNFIIPYRNREKHLEQFLFHIPEFLIGFETKYNIYVINQTEDKLFNRGKLFNVGVLLSDGDYYALHDVDLMPLEADYSYIEKPTHLSSRISEFKYKLPYSSNFGGVTLINKEDYYKFNGFSNEYWGWGAEDDDLYQRIVKSGLSPDRRCGKFLSLKHAKIGRYGNPNYNNNLKRLNDVKSGLIDFNLDGIKQTTYNLIKTEKLNCPVEATMFTVEI